MKTAVLIGPGAGSVATTLAEDLGVPAVMCAVRVFPDGETCVRFELDPAIDRLIIVHGTHGPQDRHLQQLFQMVESAAYQGCRNISCVVPYLAYSRQDWRSSPGEPLTARIVVDCLAHLGASELVTIDVHNPDVYRDASLHFTNLTASAAFAERLRNRGLEKTTVVSPDLGGAARGHRFAKQLGAPVVVYDKSKNPDGHTWYAAGSSLLEGAHAVIIDDLCSSGSTLKPLVKQLLCDGSVRVTICITHMLSDRPALARKLGDRCELLCCDSIPSAAGEVSVAPLIARHFRSQMATPLLVGA